MKYRAITLLVLFLVGVFVLAGPGGCAATRSASTSDAKSAHVDTIVLQNSPTICLVYLDEGNNPQSFSSGALIAPNLVLTSPHVLPQDAGRVIINGDHLTHYTISAAEYGPTDASGWVVIRLSEPLYKDFSTVAYDFVTPLSPGTPLFVVGVTAEVAMSQHFNFTNQVISGKVVVRPLYDKDDDLDEFLLVDAPGGDGLSGASVYTWPPDSDVPQLIGIWGGVKEYTDEDHKLVGSVGLVRRPSTLRLR